MMRQQALNAGILDSGKIVNRLPVLAGLGFLLAVFLSATQLTAAQADYTDQARRDICQQQAQMLEQTRQMDLARQQAAMIKARIADIRAQKAMIRRDMASTAASSDDPHHDYRQLQRQMNDLDHQESMWLNRLDQISRNG